MNKKLLYLLVAVLAPVLFLACGSASEYVSSTKTEEPHEVALSFLKALEKGEVDGLVEKRMHFNSKQEEEKYKGYFSRVKGLMEQRGDTLANDAGFELVSSEVSGDTAYVKFKGKNAFDKNTVVGMRLLKIDKEWRVDASYPFTHAKK